MLSTRASLLRLVLLVSTSCGLASAKIIYVDTDAAGAHNGSSWANAYNHLQGALVVASHGDDIWVAEGIYRPDEDANYPDGTGDREQTFLLTSDVGIYGGFPPGGGTLEQRDPNAYETILSGDLDGNDVDVSDPCDLLYEPTRQENSYHIVTADGTDKAAVLDGFVITGGNANGSPADDDGGAVRASEVTLRHCVFVANSASSHGGAVSLHKTTVTNCTFSGNAAHWGGGLDGWYLTVKTCTFAANWAGDGGGASVSNSTFVDCTFSENVASSGGGMANGGGTVTNCTFIENTADSGGGMANSDGILIGCRFIRNTAANGGALNNAGLPTLINCAFTGNRAFGRCGPKICPESKGGAVYETSPATYINCIFSGNSAGWGGALYNTDSWNCPSLTNCTLSGNSARGSQGSPGAGGAIYTDDSGDIHLTNCILWGNTDGSGAGLSAQISYCYPASYDGITYCCVQDDDPNDGSAPCGGHEMHNIDVNPMFVRPPSDGGNGWGDDPSTLDVDEGANDDFGDLHLMAGSPCIDAGNNEVDTGMIGESLTGRRLTAIDRENHVRNADDPAVPDTGTGSAPIVDMGAYEFASRPLSSQVFVDCNAVGAGDGTSWTDAFVDLNLALRTAMAAAGGITDIWVAAGRYIPDPCGLYSINTATFRLVNDVGLYGGFPPEGGDWQDRDRNTHVTILSGKIGQLRRALHVVTASYCDQTAILDGFTITDGRANGSLQDGCGGGMYTEYGSPAVENCIFTANEADYGGGMYNRHSHPTLTNCTFTLNSGDGSRATGGGMYNQNSNPTLENCTFANNTTSNSSGMHNKESNPTLVDCTFTKNSAVNGPGGIYNDLRSCPMLINCVFAGNSALGRAGGIYNSFDSCPTLVNCVFTGNWASGGGAGGIHSREGSKSNLINCTLAGNSVVSYHKSCGAGLHIADTSSLATLVNCIVWGNMSSISGSSSGGATDESGQIHGLASVLFSCIQDADPNDGWIPFGGAGAHNIDDNPQFRRPPNDGGDGWGDISWTLDIDEGANNDFGDVRLLPGSPCIDAGDNLAVPADTSDIDDDGDTTERIPWDHDRRARFFDDLWTDDTGNGSAPVVDLGAYEFGCAYTGDLDRDCDVDFLDYAIVAQTWLTEPSDDQWDRSCDISIPVDNCIDALDLAAFADQWLVGAE